MVTLNNIGILVIPCLLLLVKDIIPYFIRRYAAKDINGKFNKEILKDINKDIVFVLTPSDNEFIEDYIVVKSTCDNIKLRALRGDKDDLSYTKNSILGHILEYIVKSRIVIANISNRNPNVYYELGIAHMLGKPSVLICRKNAEIPFDLQQKYIVFYENKEELSEKLNDALLNMLTV